MNEEDVWGLLAPMPRGRVLDTLHPQCWPQLYRSPFLLPNVKCTALMANPAALEAPSSSYQGREQMYLLLLLVDEGRVFLRSRRKTRIGTKNIFHISPLHWEIV